ncbi:MAG: CCA tRNA nucleotidyltransferase [Spirochaetia bacterium]
MIERITPSLSKVYEILKDAGFECFIVGGAVRDYLINQAAEISDFDLATDAHPQQVMQLFHRVIPTGIKHGTVTVLIGKERFEVTTYRLDGKYSNGRHPDEINFISGIIEDLKRRDFTMNSIAYDLDNQTFLDPNNGIIDIKHKLIRAIGDPILRFEEDGLRPLRAIRFVAQLGFHIEETTLEAIKECFQIPKKVSHERIAVELFKIAQGQDAIIALMLMQKTGLLSVLLPSLELSYELSHPTNFIKFIKCSSKKIKEIPIKELNCRLLFLLCLSWQFSIQREDSTTLKEDRIKKFKSIAKTYRFSSKMTQTLGHLLQFLPFLPHTILYSDYEIRLLLKSIQLEYLPELLIIWKALAFEDSENEAVRKIELRFEKVLSIPYTALTLKQLAISGEELIKNLNLQPGKKLGVLLNHLLDYVLQDPNNNQKDRLLILASQITIQ